MKKVLWSLFGVVVLVLLGYGYGISYYADKFQANTKIGTVDLSNMTLTQAEKKIEKNLNDQNITLTENGQELGQFSLKDISPKLASADQLKAIYNSQNPNVWGLSFFKGQQYDGSTLTNVTFDSERLNKALLNLGIENAQRTPAKDAYIDFTDAQGYYVVDAKAGNQVDLPTLESMIVEGVQNGAKTIEINKAYVPPKVQKDDPSIKDFMAKIDKAISTKITLNIDGNKEVIPKSEIQKWLYFDESNQIVYDESMIQEFLKQYNDKYATYLKDRQFNSTLQGVVTVPAGTLGWSIDREAEASQIAKDLYNEKDVERDPAIVGTGYGQSGDDIGNSYVEVDVTNQTMFIYLDGELALQTPVVTGQLGTDTILGAYAIWDKEENASLKGYNPRTQKEYNQPVSYWMPFDDTGQGIHDANWQPAFGGDNYLYRGSLGCINTPPDIMPQVYALAYTGMPVIVFQ